MITQAEFLEYAGIDLKYQIKGDYTNIDKNIEIFFNRMYNHLINNLPGLKVPATDDETATLKKAVMEQGFYQLSVGDFSLMGELLPISMEAVKILKNGGLWSYRL
jgi:hypothetical protein